MRLSLPPERHVHYLNCAAERELDFFLARSDGHIIGLVVVDRLATASTSITSLL